MGDGLMQYIPELKTSYVYEYHSNLLSPGLCLKWHVSKSHLVYP